MKKGDATKGDSTEFCHLTKNLETDKADKKYKILQNTKGISFDIASNLHGQTL